MSTVILPRTPVQSQSEFQPQFRDILDLRYAAYESLIKAFRRVPPRLHHTLLAQTLTFLLDLDDLSSSPLITLAELLFSLIDRCTEPQGILDLQRLLVHFTLALGSDDWPSKKR